MLVRQFELDFLHCVKDVVMQMLLVQKGNYILLHKCFGCESTWHENSKFVQCDP